MDNYKLTVGLEIHTELKTRTKMFCSCKNDPDEARPNHNICPVCMGHPGTLPYINKEAVKSVLKVGAALGGRLASKSEFDRKNYFYPDIPKGYQISQHKHPLVAGGELAGVAITRVHLEEDTASSTHGEGGSLVDFNRAGVPLMELVTEPVINTPELAGHFARELQLLLQYLGVSEANMEKGEMRVEANISVSKDAKLGTKVEVKNLNSFRVVERAIAYEAKRQAELLESGGAVVQETRGWDEAKQATYSQRTKEDSHDYRYFPDPDLPKLDFSLLPELTLEEISQTLTETPNKKRERISARFGIKKEDVDTYINDRDLSEIFEQAAQYSKAEGYQLLSNFILSVVGGIGQDKSKLNPKIIAEIVEMQSKGEISSLGAKEILAKVIEVGGDPHRIAEENNLLQKSDIGFITELVRSVIAQNEEVVAQYKAGKGSAIQFLVGQAMKASKGSANPGVVRGILEQELS